MSKANRNKQNNDDALRTNDIMPPYNMLSVHKVPEELADARQQKREIPKFDLAEEIMAEHRKVTAAKRKAPNKKSGALNQQEQAESIGQTVIQPTILFSKQQQIIAEIVKRDIAQMCGISAYDHLTFDL